MASDRDVFRVAYDQVRSSMAYLLFYERDPLSLRYNFDRYSSGRRRRGSRLYSESVDSADSGTQLEDDNETAILTAFNDEGCSSATAEEEEENFTESDEFSDTCDEGFTEYSKAEVIRSFALHSQRAGYPDNASQRRTGPMPL